MSVAVVVTKNNDIFLQNACM